MSDDTPAVMKALFEDPYLVEFYLTREEAEVVRDVLARVAGDGPRADAARRVFEALEAGLGYDVTVDDGFEGEIVTGSGDVV